MLTGLDFNTFLREFLEYIFFLSSIAEEAFLFLCYHQRVPRRTLSGLGRLRPNYQMGLAKVIHHLDFKTDFIIGVHAGFQINEVLDFIEVMTADRNDLGGEILRVVLVR